MSRLSVRELDSGHDEREGCKASIDRLLDGYAHDRPGLRVRSLDVGAVDPERALGVLIGEARLATEGLLAYVTCNPASLPREEIRGVLGHHVLLVHTGLHEWG